MSGWQLSGYTPVRPLGAGASGAVVLATHDETGTPVAIKYLVPGLSDDASFRATFRNEARLLGEIDDPHVSRLYEYIESADGAAIVMELVNGVTLRQMLREQGPTTTEAALSVLKGSVLGLGAAHDHGVVHRDYKPENVLVTGEGLSKLADFGVAAQVGQGDGTVVTGTPRYMAPEQWTGAPATPACDIYAATATFFECLTGKPPYDGENLFALHNQHVNAPIPTDPAPEPVHDLLRHGMAKLPADRPANAHAFLGMLEQVAGDAYGPDWEDRGLNELARRAALLAALWPFPEGAPDGALSLATTVFAAKPRRRVLRGNRKWVALACGLIVALLLGGAGYRYASGTEHPAAAADPPKPPVVEPVATATTATTPLAPPVSASSPAPTPSVTPTTTPPTTGPTPTTAPTTRKAPTTAPTTKPVKTTKPTTSPTASKSPTPPPDRTPPVVGSISSSPTEIEASTCRYGYRTSTITVDVTDNVSGPSALKVTFHYTLSGATSTVSMSSAGGSGFQGTIGPLAMPKTATRIPISVTAVDAAGNSGKSGSVGYVTLSNICNPG